MKAFYTNKGKYKDGRKKVVIMFEGKVFTLPKPEVLLDMLHLSKKEDKTMGENKFW